jgi:hypothetical protein
VTGENAVALREAIAPFRESSTLRWEHAEAGLEDVFIHLMKNQEPQ